MNMIFLFYETMTLDMVKTTKQQEHTDWIKTDTDKT